MKAIFALFVILAATASLHAQACITRPCDDPFEPDVVHYGYTGDQTRGGVLYTNRQSDQVSGSAEVYAGYYSNTYPNGWYIGDGLRATNPEPGCGPVTYSIQSVEKSWRDDNVPDKIQQVGTAWWVAQFPQIYNAYESGNLVGNSSNAFVGTAYIVQDTAAQLPPGCTPGGQSMY